MHVAHSSAGSAAGPNRQLETRILALLGRCDGLTAGELASSAYGPRAVVRRGWHLNAPASRLWAVRRVLRRLQRGDLIAVVGIECRRKVFALAGREPLRLTGFNLTFDV